MENGNHASFRRKAIERAAAVTRPVRHNPLPFLLIGAGLAWLLVKSDNERAQHVSQAGRRARHRLDELADDNPLALGAAALGAGVLMGLLLPVSETERHVLEEARYRLLDKAACLAPAFVANAFSSKN